MIAQVRSEGLSEGVVKRTLDPNKNVGVLFVCLFILVIIGICFLQ